jgi:hypothetical protein
MVTIRKDDPKKWVNHNCLHTKGEIFIHEEKGWFGRAFLQFCNDVWNQIFALNMWFHNQQNFENMVVWMAQSSWIRFKEF